MLCRRFYSGGYFAAVVVLFGGCFSTVSCFVVATVLCAGLALQVATVRASCLEGPPFVLLLLSAAAAVCEFVCAFSLVFLFL